MRIGCTVAAVSIAAVVSAPVAGAASTLTVCHSGCTDTTIQAAVTAANAGDTVDVMASGSPYTEQVNVTKQITLQGDPGGPAPLLKFEPSSFVSPTLQFMNAADGSTLKHLAVLSDGVDANDAIFFAQTGTITDVSATATARAIVTNPTGTLTIGPSVSATATGTATALSVVNPSVVTVLGVTATANTAGAEAAGIVGAGSGTITDSTFSGGSGIGRGLVVSGVTVRRVVGVGGSAGIFVNGGPITLTDSLAIATTSSGAAFEAQPTTTAQVRNVTAIGTSGADGVRADPNGGGSGGAAIIAKNVIARGSSPGVDVNALATNSTCLGSPPCSPGTIQIGYSNFVTKSASGVDTTLGHNQSGDPQFVNGTVGPSQDFHLQFGSPVIGAGTTDTQTGTTDLDGRPRPPVGSSAPSMGAYELVKKFNLTVTVSGNGSVAGGGINCPGTCSAVFADGSPVTLTATPSASSTFAGWSGACTGTGSCQLTVSGDRAVTATFAPIPGPVNTAVPQIGGAPTVSSTLFASDGAWSGSPTSFAYQWRSCDAAGKTCSDIAGATTNALKLTTAQVDHTVRVVVTATNIGGPTPATSAQTGLVTGTPALSKVGLGSRRFLAKKGTTLKLTLSERATIQVLITQKVHGRKVRGRCKQHAKHGSRCTLNVQKARLSFRGAAGANAFRLLVKSLAPGSYSATITASSGGKKSRPVMLGFTILKPPKHH